MTFATLLSSVFKQYVIEIFPNFVELLPNFANLLPNYVELLPNIFDLLPNFVELLPNFVELFPCRKDRELLKKSIEAHGGIYSGSLDMNTTG